MKRTQRVALIGILIALSLILGWVENMIPISAKIPGIKLGLANIVVVFALYKLGIGEAALLSVAKALLTSLLFGNMAGFLYSAAGAVLSYAAMVSVFRIKNVSPVGVSAIGGAAHVTAQVITAVILTSTEEIIRFLPLLLVSGCVTGVLTGTLTAIVLNRMEGIKDA